MQNRITPRLLFLTLLLTLTVPFPGPAAEAGDSPPTAGPAIEVQRGTATYYGGRFHGRRTASGERFDQNAMVAAHPSLPFGSVVRVTNLKNGRTAHVRIVDRGPARSARRRGVVIDLSKGVARHLGFVAQGRTPVRVEVLGSSALLPDEGAEYPG
jgi:rare lipoprotein A